MWHLIKAELDLSKNFFIILNLILGAIMLTFYEFHQNENLIKPFRALRIAGAFGAIGFAIGFPVGRSKEKRDRQHSLLPKTHFQIGITRLFTGTIFWTALASWVLVGKYLTQDVSSHTLFLKEAGYTFALAISLNALVYIIHDQMYFKVSIAPQNSIHPFISILVALSIATLTLLFIESSFQIFNWQIPKMKTFFLASYFYIALLLFASLAISYASGLFFARRKSYLA